MTYAFVQDMASSWEQYQRHTARLLEPAPEGLILHVAGPTDDGVRIIDLWTTEEAWRRFEVERLEPAADALDGRARAQPTFRDLHPTQLVVGSGSAVELLTIHEPKEEQ
jgi:hypothetical protein